MASYGEVVEFLRSISAPLSRNSTELQEKIWQYLSPVFVGTDEEDDEPAKQILQPQIYNFCSVLIKKWNSIRNRSRFEVENEVWLRNTFKLTSASKQTESGPGRPAKSFDDSSECVKRRKVADIIQTVPPKNLAFAAKMALNTSGGIGSRSAAYLLEQATEYSPDRPRKIKNAWTKSAESQVVQMKPDEALGKL